MQEVILYTSTQEDNPHEIQQAELLNLGLEVIPIAVISMHLHIVILVWQDVVYPFLNQAKKLLVMGTHVLSVVLNRGKVAHSEE
jgi:hypothetical protein